MTRRPEIMKINIEKLTAESFLTPNIFAELEQAALAGLLEAEIAITDEAKANAKAAANSNNNTSSSSDDTEVSERIREFLDEYELKKCHIYYGDNESADRTIVLVIQKEEMQLRVKAVLSYTFDILTYLDISACRGFDKEKAREYIDDLADILLDNAKDDGDRETKEKSHDYDLLMI